LNVPVIESTIGLHQDGSMNRFVYLVIKDCKRLLSRERFEANQPSP